MDLDSIRPGANFVQAIESALSNCSLVLVMVGSAWLGPSGANRFHDPNDHVRRELELAIWLRRTIVPMFVDGATMPPESYLPRSLGDLVHRNGIAVTPAGYRAAVQQLVALLNRTASH